MDDDGNITFINEAWLLVDMNGTLWTVCDKSFGTVDIAREMMESDEGIDDFLTLKMEKPKGVSFPVPVFSEHKA